MNQERSQELNNTMPKIFNFKVRKGETVCIWGNFLQFTLFYVCMCVYIKSSYELSGFNQWFPSSSQGKKYQILCGLRIHVDKVNKIAGKISRILLLFRFTNLFRMWCARFLVHAFGHCCCYLYCDTDTQNKIAQPHTCYFSKNSQ